MKKVRVLMSTYNGQKYLKEQLDSILLQKDVETKILVRDDGSTDETLSILNEYKKQGKLEWYNGKNLRPAKSFMNLLKNSGNYEYYAFADQDDYWKEDKLSKAINRLEEVDSKKPALYFCDKELVDSKLNHIKHKKINYKVSFESAMIKNIATGCTMVMNKNLVEIVNSYSPSYIVMHDAWIYRVCLAIGGICIYDDGEYIKYRQHGNNVIGAQEGVVNKTKRRWNNFWHCDHSREKTARELLNGYSDLINKNKLNVLQQISNYRNSWKAKVNLIKNTNMKTESLENNISFRIALLLNKV